jgi:hypothetical protein
MAIATTALRNTLAGAYASAATYAALYTTAPSSTAGTEVSGGSPAYSRKAITWSAASNGAVTASVVFDVPTGTTIRGIGIHNASTAGTYLDGVTVSDQAFTSQGTYTVSLSFTIS